MAGEPRRKKGATANGTKKGIGIHIGLNAIDRKHYGTNGALAGCEFDANDMAALAESKGFKTTKLLTRAATSQKVSDAIRGAATALSSGDMLLLTYSGHGGQVPDTNGDEADRKDETWCLYDREMVDDELYSMYAQFQPGVQIVVLSDSCHSGTVARGALYQDVLLPQAAAFGATGDAKPATFKTRSLGKDIEDQTYESNKELYDAIQKANPRGERDNVKADILLISGCADNQLSGDGDRNGLFTATLLAVWSKGRFRGTYRRFYQAISERMPPYQSPNYYRVGAVNQALDLQAPFKI
jgi:metacaspase-1